MLIKFLFLFGISLFIFLFVPFCVVLLKRFKHIKFVDKYHENIVIYGMVISLSLFIISCVHLILYLNSKHNESVEQTKNEQIEAKNAILNSDKNFYLIAFLNIPQYNNEDVLKKEDGFIKLYPCSYLFITDKELTSNLINIDNKIIVQANFIVKLTKDEMIEEIIKNKKYKILIEK